MEIVIDIPGEIKKKRDAGKVLSSEEIATVCMAIKNGAQLPKGHGKLIDADAYKKNVFKKFPCNSSDDRNMRRLTELALKDAQTIIEADGGDTE